MQQVHLRNGRIDTTTWRLVTGGPSNAGAVPFVRVDVYAREAPAGASPDRTSPVPRRPGQRGFRADRLTAAVLAALATDEQE